MKKTLQRRISKVNIESNLESLHPLLRRIYSLRGICSAEELQRTASHLLNFNQLYGIDQAVQLLFQAISENKHIIIVGDFDTDGATSTTLVIKTLRKLGVQSLDYIIPDRFEDGYGLSTNVVKRAIQKQAQLIITVDNGISSLEGVELARQHAIQVIITDHHLPPTTLPHADAIINPNLSNCHFPSKSLAGVGVAFYFMLALRAHLRQCGWLEQQGIPDFNLASLLDLVALGTIADVVPLDCNNRILVHQGINRIRAGHCCIGIKALIETANRQCEKITSSDLSYILAPRLNAAGRMENMSLGIELLLCENEKLARQMAEELNALNQERRDVEQSMQNEALIFVNQIEQSLENIPNGIVLYHPEWHQGVIGILSARIKDKYYRPVISFAAAGDGYLKGSGRSIDGFHLRDALERIDSMYPNTIECFGGHAMAAGLTIHEDQLASFKNYFEQLTAEWIDDTLLHNIILTDGDLDSSLFNCDTAKIIQDAGPWGQGFPEPLFDGEFKIHQQRLVGEKHLKLVIEPINGGPLIDGIAFNIDLNQWPDNSIKRAQLAYHLDINEFRGKQTVQLLIRHLWPVF